MSDVLAIEGGPAVRSIPLPTRKAVGAEEREAILGVIDYYDELGVDPGYQGHFEHQYCEAFAEFQGGGYCDVVASGTLALYCALFALDLPPKCEVLVSPITDPGTLNAIIFNQLTPKLMDVQPNSYNSSLLQLEARMSPSVKAVLLVHSCGSPVDVVAIANYCKAHNIKLIEDCSQAHGAVVEGQRVGTFGDIAAFSTMFSKISSTGATGGVVYSKNQILYQRALAFADRGKPIWREDYNPRDPNQALFPALNLNANEYACAMGLVSLNRLEKVREARVALALDIAGFISSHSKLFCAHSFDPTDSPFVQPIYIQHDYTVHKTEHIANALKAEGIPLNPRYPFMAGEWKWLNNYLADDFCCREAAEVINRSFCLYINEHYDRKDRDDIKKALLKIDDYFT